MIQFLKELAELRNRRIMDYIPEKVFKRLSTIAQHRKENTSMTRGKTALEPYRKPTGKYLQPWALDKLKNELRKALNLLLTEFNKHRSNLELQLLPLALGDDQKMGN